ncbi:MAG: rRNA maturation RNase YbeY [Candidatus Kerfeldbacteria bacterium]|nr:rRNA maturation RNase YbeY [Candidatus Kerfeldbacteria bacterium]
MALVGRETSARLNAQYRGKRGPTNVLAFATPDVRTGTLGDLVVCLPVARAEALRYGRALNDHVALLVVHGLLHLVGYDHQRTHERARMEQFEQRLLTRCHHAS